MIYVLSISGGKDSTALWAWARRTGLGDEGGVVGVHRRQLAQNTGWEFDGTPDVASWREYLATLVAAFKEPLTVIEAPVLFEPRVRAHNTFPGVLNRRAELDEREWSDFYDCEVWRPLLTWSLEQVIREHHDAGVPLNPLYLAGAERVGCWPCIKASKAEIALVARIDPARIARIREIEAATGNMMFTIEEPKKKGEPRKLVPYPIDEIVKWARTERGWVCHRERAATPPAFRDVLLSIARSAREPHG